ncbi:uncharacterized protein LOC125236057 [Leguminivora glycinivorella]|uniref:uncharacterized protein LOC125236057 n=1 Tax=Leguminivora glycinivorella TaxID=1035111 RepID=UPI00200BFC20|nr:uncharacterized protein LOC125236057 [Leguminivora glycinivorella]
MVQFKFEGDFDILGDPQIKLVESVLRNRGYSNGTVLVEQVGIKGDNYVAHVKRFTYKSEEGSTFKIIGKIAPAAEELRNMMKTMLLFNNEIVMYDSILPKLNDLQNIVGNEDKVIFPACYGVVTEAPYEFILLEDLNELYFVMLDRLKPLTNDSIRIVTKDLAMYHSLSLVLRNSEPEVYDNFANKLTNIWAAWDAEPQMQQFSEAAENEILEIIDDSDKYKNLVLGSISKMASHARDHASYEKDSKYTVIQQGDCWNNNILFRLENGTPVQNVMIDYQLSKEGSPAGDILYFLFNCTDHATRLKYYNEWIDYYYEIMESTLKKHGLETSTVFLKERLLADLKRYSRLAIGLGLMLSSMLSRESKDTFDFKEMSGDKDKMLEDAIANICNLSLDQTTIERLKGRITGIIDTVLELGLL